MAGHVGKLVSSTDLETISAAAKAQKVARQTLSDQEAAMNEWLILNSSMATPLHP
ncbi:hypothetical protein EDD16DRAFT_1709394 [Pisolithus croceorrhizus]|nr:hypothetical protein EDD16DRAFT_1709394 [Pisolithus croceorrhizus]KAI6165430.1 hypothetical protein EDD17DRAFT_1754141 [Pisolithus thermaeus]